MIMANEKATFWSNYLDSSKSQLDKEEGITMMGIEAALWKLCWLIFFCDDAREGAV